MAVDGLKPPPPLIALMGVFIVSDIWRQIRSVWSYTHRVMNVIAYSKKLSGPDEVPVIPS